MPAIQVRCVEEGFGIAAVRCEAQQEVEEAATVGSAEAALGIATEDSADTASGNALDNDSNPCVCKCNDSNN